MRGPHDLLRIYTPISSYVKNYLSLYAQYSSLHSSNDDIFFCQVEKAKQEK